MNAVVVTIDSFLHEEIKAGADCVLEQNILPGVTSQDHVIIGAMVVDSRFSSHGGHLCVRYVRLPVICGCAEN